MRHILLLFVLALAACGTPAAVTPEARNAPTLTAPAWVTGNQPITLENVDSIRYLGRIDPPDVVATWFDAALSPDSTALAAINIDQLAQWNLLTGETLFYTGRGEAVRVFYSPDKTEMYGVETSGRVAIYNALTGQQINQFSGHSAFSGVAAYDANAGLLALGGTDGTIRVWNTLERQAQVTINAHSGRINTLAFAPNGVFIASTAADGRARLWDWQPRTLLAETDATEILRTSFAPDSATIALGMGTSVALWTPNADPVTLDTRGSDVMQFSGDGRYLLAGSRSDGLTLWNAPDATLIGIMPDTAGDGVAAAFSPDGALLITSTLNRGVYLWNLNAVTGTQLSQAPLDVGTRQIYDVRWTDDARLILLFDAVGAIYMWGIP